MTARPTFEDFFKKATESDEGGGGYAPYGYQSRLAAQGLPPVIQAPTGAGKTGVVLAWLWRRLYGSPDETARRLIFALPQRTLVEQVAGEVERWLEALGLTEQVSLHVVMGGAGRTQHQWRMDMHRPAIVVGTVDSLVSKALNRGYGIARAVYPIDFALVTNGAHWVIDEIQLAPAATATMRQLAAFAAHYGTVEPFGLTCMSATVSPHALRTVDNPDLAPTDVMQIAPEDRVGELARRLEARRTVRQLPDATSPEAIARAVVEHHRPGTLTLVVVNTVATARNVYQRLPATAARRTLMHSRFRGVERAALVERLKEPPGDEGHIVISTQVVEAGVDIDAATLITEAAPWPSLVQRAGRCNRRGRYNDATLYWIHPANPGPYEAADVDASIGALTELEGEAVTGEDLLDQDVAVTEPALAILRRPDLLTLFDTAPDLTGADLDIAPYVRDADDLDVQLAWARWASESGRDDPPNNAKAPAMQWRCRAPINDVRNLLKRATAWRFDHSSGRWLRLSRTERPRPGEVLVLRARDGGYDPAYGFDPTSKKEVPEAPELGDAPDVAAGAEDAFPQDDTSVAQPQWELLEDHSNDVKRHATALIDALSPDLPADVADAVVVAGYTHDAGKSHDIWQEAICRLETDQAEREKRLAAGPWAKSAQKGRLWYRGGVTFRHELVSMLLLDGPLRPLLKAIQDTDLVRYLVLAHHGKLRVQVRSPNETDAKLLLGLRDGEVIRANDLLGHSGEVVVHLADFQLGSEKSWTRTALALRDRYGPFRLAYLETLVRIADWRASAGMRPAGEEQR